jgi:hypothetical protein
MTAEKTPPILDNAGLVDIPSEDAHTNATTSYDFLTGWRLYQVVAGLSASYFLILLNSTIVVTVSDFYS